MFCGASVKPLIRAAHAVPLTDSAVLTAVIYVFTAVVVNAAPTNFSAATNI